MNRAAASGGEAREPRGEIRLGEITADPTAGELRGPGGREQLDPKVMAVLTALARRAGTLVSREELLRQVWPGLVVTDDVLSRCVYQLRRHLVRTGGDERYRALLVTLPKRGYRLDGELPGAPPEPAPAAQRVRRSWRVAAAVLGVAVVAAAAWVALTPRPAPGPSAQIHSTPIRPGTIAVLPFSDLSPAQDQQYFVDGLTEELIHLLARRFDRAVIARTSSFALREERSDVRAIAAKLGVAHVLEGSVRKAGDRVRVTAQLIDAETGLHLWSETYERPLEDVFAMQDAIAAAVAIALQAELAVQPPSRKPSPAAYEQFLQAQFFYNRRGPGDVERAAAHFERAVELDPTFARAWVGLAGTYRIAVSEGTISVTVGLERQREALDRALALDPQLAEAHARAAHYHSAIGQTEIALRHVARAVELGRDDPLALSVAAGFAVSRGEIEEAIALQQRALLLDPVVVPARWNLAMLLLAAHRLDEAEVQLRRAVELNPAVAADIEGTVVTIRILQGRVDEALELAERLPAGAERNRALAIIHHAGGRPEEAARALAQLRAVGGAEAAVYMAEVHAVRGELDEAFRWLEAVSADVSRDPPLVDATWVIGARQSPFLQPLRSDPRWAAWRPRRE